MRFSLCLVRFQNIRSQIDKNKESPQKIYKKNKQLTWEEQLAYAKNIHLKIMTKLASCVSFDKVCAFEREIKANIVIFHHIAGRKHLECYKTHDEIDDSNAWSSLGDNYYHLMENLRGFCVNIVMRHMKQPCVITVNSDAMSVLQMPVINIQPTPKNGPIVDAYANLISVSSNTSGQRVYTKRYRATHVNTARHAVLSIQ